MSNAKAINAYRMYLAVKMHFMSDNYNITEHRGNIRVSYKKFDERNQQSLYEKFADKFSTKQEMAQYLIANFAYGAWGNTDIVYGTAESDQNHKEWLRRKQSITQILKNDLSKIKLHYESNEVKFDPDVSSTFPNIAELLKMYLGKHITLETVIILDKYHPFLDSWKQSMGSLFVDEIRRIVKARPFVKFDDAKIKPVVMEFIEEY
jgi:hypothetical protein